MISIHLKQVWSTNCFSFFLMTDAQLLTIKTIEENDFVSKYMSDDPLITSRVWLDVHLNAQGKPPHLKYSKTVKLLRI